MRTSWLLLCGIATVVAGELSPRPAAAGLADVAAAPADGAVANASAKANESTKPPPKPKRMVRTETSEPAAPEAGESKSRLSNKPKPLLKEHTQLPERNPPIYEWNLPFLGPGNIIQ